MNYPMKLESLDALIRQVESSPVEELVKLDIDEVYRVGDELIERNAEDMASLYRRWEVQQWRALEIDLSDDVRQWSGLPEPIKRMMSRIFTFFYFGESAVRDTLSPVIYATPLADERNYLATQLADEARHAVFFERFFAEVLKFHDGLEAAIAALHPGTQARYREINIDLLGGATEKVRERPGDQVAWVEAVVTYHLMIEGYTAHYGQATLMRTVRSLGLLPGLLTGMTAIARDESRHVGFGVAALQRRVAADPEMARVILRKVLALLPPMVLAIVGPEGPTRSIDAPRPAPARDLIHQLDPFAQRSYVIQALSRRLRRLGFSEPMVAEVERQDTACWEAAWDLYEQLQGHPHPARQLPGGGAGRRPDPN